jgi:crotonobetainyl-CoA:carnitine CoA-transferase CaiB-like acyl-CoA transferase
VQRPLEGLRILEASGEVAVRYRGRLFAQLGAARLGPLLG